MEASKRENLAGRVFGDLEVLTYSHNVGRTPYWVCKCSCGVEKNIAGPSLKRGAVVSCGHRKVDFLKSRAKHGKHGSRLYGVWAQMIQRCTNENHESYVNYGGRGIGVCAEWRDFSAFEADMGPSWAEGLTLDRRDNSLGYSKSNCRWITRSEQLLNRRPRSEWKNDGKRAGGVRIETPKGEMNLLQASREFGINYGTLRKRLDRGMTPAEALTMPVVKRKGSSP